MLKGAVLCVRLCIARAPWLSESRHRGSICMSLCTKGVPVCVLCAWVLPCPGFVVPPFNASATSTPTRPTPRSRPGRPRGAEKRRLSMTSDDSDDGDDTGGGANGADDANGGDGDGDVAESDEVEVTTKGFSSSYIGVSWHRASCRWHGQIRHSGKRISLGYFHTEVEAARAYDKVCVAVQLCCSALSLCGLGGNLLTRGNSAWCLDSPYFFVRRRGCYPWSCACFLCMSCYV